MSKESSIKVFAENASGTRPANAIPVWVDNISAIGGGASEEQINELSAAIDYVSANAGDQEVSTVVQSNSASFSGDNNIYYTTEGHYGQDLNSAYEAGKRIVVKMNDGELLPVYKKGSNFYGYYISECWSNPNQLKVQQYYINQYDGYTSKTTINNPGVADWNCTNSADLSYIRNKPQIPDTSTIVQYGASGLNFPNSNFKVDTSGNVFKITREGEETQVTGKAYIDSSEISFILNGTFEPGTYEFRMPDHYSTLTNPDGGTKLSVLNGVAKWVNTSEKTFSWKYLSPGPRGEPFLNTSNGSIWKVPNDVDLKYALSSELPTYQYDDTNKISAINGSAIGGGSIPVSNSGDLYKVEFDGVDLYGYKNTTEIPNFVYSAKVEGNTQGQVMYYPYIPNDFNSNGIQDFQNWSGFDVISLSSCDGGQLYPPEAGEYGLLTALDVYYSACYLRDYNENQLSGFSGYLGKITQDNLVISSHFDKPSYFNNIFRGDIRLSFSANVNREGALNNTYKVSVGNEVQSGTSTFEGISVPQIQFVATSAAATGTNILYVVTGSN